MATKQAKLLVVYNPSAGQKRQQASLHTATSLEEIKDLFKRYQLICDFQPTKRPKHALELARKAVVKGYEMVIAAGGDGTVGEVATGLVGTEVTMGILPLGTFMNVARMLAVPQELEKAVMLIKIGRTRLIDVGEVRILNGNQLAEPQYFLENFGVGFEARLQRVANDFEQGKAYWFKKFIGSLFNPEDDRVELEVDGQKYFVLAPYVTIANAPFAGAALKLAPEARLNDHRLTVTVYPFARPKILRYIVKLMTTRQPNDQLWSFNGQRIKVTAKRPRQVHADGRLFGRTPAELKVRPGALKVIYGFPSGETALEPRTYLDP